MVQPAVFSSRSPSQGYRGPPWAPRCRKSATNPGQDSSFNLPKVCKVVRVLDGGPRGAPRRPPWAFPGSPGASRRPPGPKTNKSKTLIQQWRQGDGHANQGSGRLQPGFRPEPKIVYISGLNGHDRPPDPSKKLEDVALHHFWRVWKPVGPV